MRNKKVLENISKHWCHPKSKRTVAESWDLKINADKTKCISFGVNLRQIYDLGPIHYTWFKIAISRLFWLPPTKPPIPHVPPSLLGGRGIYLLLETQHVSTVLSMLKQKVVLIKLVTPWPQPLENQHRISKTNPILIIRHYTILPGVPSAPRKGRGQVLINKKVQGREKCACKQRWCKQLCHESPPRSSWPPHSLVQPQFTLTPPTMRPPLTFCITKDSILTE
ncbi:hypothetical protein E2C01_022208 [Portunus trituberculatus]|uniref:Uncharacterized protein n=1 Tax=Portunus trituberculatus TaxID=210409 RepID=A0A5B7E4S1_PORTR|nr:hypothetical protein [Portunus trituberculatus]